jgi:hypothetical protein
MAATTDEKPATASISDTEKDLSSRVPDKFTGFEDPDAGLSEEERAEIVCTSDPTSWHSCISSRRARQLLTLSFRP